MAWTSMTKADRTFDILLQDHEADCGLCCVAMVVNLLKQGKPNSATVKEALRNGAYNPSTKDRAAFKPSLLTAVLPDVSTRSSGTYLLELQKVLTTWKIASTYDISVSNVQAAIQGAVAGQPIICHVTWTSGGGHWVVITHSMGMSHYILDPSYGLQINSNLMKYVGLEQGSASPGRVKAVEYGTWTGEWLKISGLLS
jgi:hypothetical protein